MLDSLSYKSSSSASRFDDFEYIFNFDAILEPGEVRATRIASEPLKIDANRDYTLVLTGPLESPDVLVWDADERAWSEGDTVFEARFSHLAESLGPLDAYLVEEDGEPGPGNALGTVAYGEAVAPLELPSSRRALVVTTSGVPDDVVYSAPAVTFTQQLSYLLTIFDADEVDTAPYSVRYTATGGLASPLPDTRYPPTLRLYHAATSMPATDVYNDEALQSLVTANLAFGSVTGDLPMSSGAKELTFTAAGNPSVKLLEETVTISAGTHASLILFDDATDATPESYFYVSDRRSVSTYAKASLFHAAANQDTVNIYVLPPGETPTDNLPRFGIQYSGISAQTPVTPGSYDLFATETDSKTPLAGPTRLDLAAGDVVEILLLDTVDPDKQPSVSSVSFPRCSSLDIGRTIVGGILGEILHVVHRGVCDADQVPELLTVLRHQRNADARRADDLLALDDVGLGRRADEALCDVLCVLDGHAGQYDGEFIAAQSAQHVLRTQAEFEPVAECLEQRVPRLVAEAVVDGLEVIQVQIEHGAL